MPVPITDEGLRRKNRHWDSNPANPEKAVVCNIARFMRSAAIRVPYHPKNPQAKGKHPRLLFAGRRERDLLPVGHRNLVVEVAQLVILGRIEQRKSARQKAARGN